VCIPTRNSDASAVTLDPLRMTCEIKGIPRKLVALINYRAPPDLRDKTIGLKCKNKYGKPASARATPPSPDIVLTIRAAASLLLSNAALRLVNRETTAPRVRLLNDETFYWRFLIIQHFSPSTFTFNTSLRPYFPSVGTMLEIIFLQRLQYTSVDSVLAASNDSKFVPFNWLLHFGNSK